MTCESDLLVIGGGPAGLSAAINGASEGLSVRIIDGGTTLGGQAKESAAIENYPGFADGITGENLAGQFIRQAIKFSTQIVSNVNAASLVQDESSKRFIITTDDYSEYVGKAVLLSLGLSYRRLQADGIGPLMGRGIFYGRPAGIQPSKKCEIAIIGGANSAGQAVVKLAANPKHHIRMLIRKSIVDQMSSYLIERIKKLPNVDVCEGCEVKRVEGKNKLENIVVQDQSGKFHSYHTDNMFIFIGAMPKTLWLKSAGLEMDPHNFIRTWKNVCTRIGALPYETSIPGVFAAGDVRSDSIKRIAAASGEGSGAIPMVHKYLSTLTTPVLVNGASL